MLEAWAFDESTLRLFAAHEETGAPIPSDLVAALRAAHSFGRASSTQQQMFYAQISLQLHMRDPTVKGFDAEGVADELASEFSPYPAVADTHFVANFGHLMGYSAIYYTYMWSQAPEPARTCFHTVNSRRICNATWTLNAHTHRRI